MSLLVTMVWISATGRSTVLVVVTGPRSPPEPSDADHDAVYSALTSSGVVPPRWALERVKTTEQSVPTASAPTLQATPNPWQSTPESGALSMSPPLVAVTVAETPTAPAVAVTDDGVPPVAEVLQTHSPVIVRVCAVPVYRRLGSLTPRLGDLAVLFSRWSQ